MLVRALGRTPVRGVHGSSSRYLDWMAGEVLQVTKTLAIPLDELEWRFSSSGGPGGQHANTSNTKAEVRFDVAASPSLAPHQRDRLLERLGPVVRAVASDERSQTRNRELALAAPNQMVRVCEPRKERSHGGCQVRLRPDHRVRPDT